MKRCDRCNLQDRHGNYRYCPECLKIIKAQMKDDGYLTPNPQRIFRTSDQKQANDRESNPLVENGIRALEGD